MGGLPQLLRMSTQAVPVLVHTEAEDVVETDAVDVIDAHGGALGIC